MHRATRAAGGRSSRWCARRAAPTLTVQEQIAAANAQPAQAQLAALGADDLAAAEELNRYVVNGRDIGRPAARIGDDRLSEQRGARALIDQPGRRGERLGMQAARPADLPGNRPALRTLRPRQPGVDHGPVDGQFAVEDVQVVERDRSLVIRQLSLATNGFANDQRLLQNT